MPKEANRAAEELLVLERHFVDILRFKMMSLFDLLTVQKKHRVEIMSFLKQLEEQTVANVELIKPYVAKR